MTQILSSDQPWLVKTVIGDGGNGAVARAPVDDDVSVAVARRGLVREAFDACLSAINELNLLILVAADLEKVSGLQPGLRKFRKHGRKTVAMARALLHNLAQLD